jgi:APA family basic amino acid/polyamine antiporter
MANSSSDGGGTHSNEGELSRVISLPQATAMVVGIIIGASIFVQPSEVTASLGSVPAIFLAWLASGILTLFGALVCAELASIFPNSGGVYVFLREAFGRPLAFLWGWAMFWTMHSGIIAAIAMGFARYLGKLLESGFGEQAASAIGFPNRLNELGQPLEGFGHRSAAIFVIIVISAVNMLGVRPGSMLQAFLTAVKLLAISIIIVIGFSFGGGNPSSALQSESLIDMSNVSLHQFGLAMVAGLFAFGGWHMVTYSAGETVDPKRTIPRALVIGTLIVTACYVFLNAVYLYVLPIEAVAGSRAIAADVATAVVGNWGGRAIAILVMVSTFGAVAGVILAGPRVYYAMAHDGVIFRRFGEIHPRWRTPTRVIAAQAVWSSVLVATGTYGEVFRRVVYTEWIFFGLMAVGLILLRRRTDLKRSHSVGKYPFVPLIFAVASFAIVGNEIASNPRVSLIGLSFVIAGLPVYYLWTYFSPPNR